MTTSLKDEVLTGNCLFHKNLGHQQPVVLNELHSQCWCSTDMAWVWCFSKSYILLVWHSHWKMSLMTANNWGYIRSRNLFWKFSWKIHNSWEWLRVYIPKVKWIEAASRTVVSFSLKAWEVTIYLPYFQSRLQLKCFFTTIYIFSQKVSNFHILE